MGVGSKVAVGCRVAETAVAVGVCVAVGGDVEVGLTKTGIVAVGNGAGVSPTTGAGAVASATSPRQ